MELNIKAIHFDTNERLEQFIAKKADKLERRYPAATLMEVTLKVVKPETAMNKNAIVKVTIPQENEMVADKTADSFEEAVDRCLDAIERQLEKNKNGK